MRRGPCFLGDWHHFFVLYDRISSLENKGGIYMEETRKSKICREKRPWGEFYQYTHNEISTVKTLIVEVGQGLSNQRHQRRYELWIFQTIGGKVSLEYADGRKEKIFPKVGDEIEIPPQTWHMLECLFDAPAPVRVTEISFGNFDEQDNERRFDRYGRK